MRSTAHRLLDSGLFSLVILGVLFFSFNNLQGQTTETFTSDGTFTVSAGVTSITVECWGAGGGGATMTNGTGGGGGGGGAYASSTFSVSPDGSFAIIVGNGGGPGVDGGNSTFGGTTVIAVGGSGVATNVNAGGSGGSGSTGTVTWIGGNGGNGKTNQNKAAGGGGGGAGSTEDGGNGGTPDAGLGGALLGGNGGNGTTTNGGNGLVYGGGGGGAGKNNGTGGSGANGYVTVTYTAAASDCPESTSVAPSTTQTLCQSDASNQLTASVTTSGGSGTPTLQYQWYYNTTNSNTVSGATLLGGATSSTYSPLTTASEVGDRWYFCVGYATDNTCAQTNVEQTLASNAVQVTVSGTPTTASAGSPQTICDDGGGTALGANTPTVGTGVWSVVSGPSTSTAQFSSTSDPTATFTPAGGTGSYVLRWTISNAPCTPSTSDVTITVNPEPTISIAGSPQEICDGDPTSLTANTPTVGTGTWSVVSGPNTSTAQFSSISDPVATFTAAGGVGEYVLRWTISNSPCTPSTSDVTITVITTPETPGSITGPTTATPNTGGFIYSISAVPNATTYNWTVPTGWSITVDTGTTSITVTSGNAGQNGNITVTAQNSCGTSDASTLAVTSENIDCPSSTSVSPTGAQNLCAGDPATELTTSVITSGGTGTPTIQYQWYYNSTNSNTVSGANLVAGATASTYTPLTTISEIGTRYYFAVGYAADNGCSQTNTTQSLASNTVQVTVDPPTPITPGSISGSASVSPNTSGLVYSISSVTYATTYNWTVPTGWTINSGNGTTSITVTSGIVGQNGNISVIASNICGTSAASTLAVTVVVAGNPPTITLGSIPTICVGTTSVNLPYTATTDSPNQYSVNFNTTAESAGFVDITNNSLPSSPIAITVPGAVATGNYNGLLSVRNSSTGLSSANYVIQITVIDTPSTPVISGQINVPANSEGFNYWVGNVPSATAYSWTVPTGWAITSGDNTNSITVTTGALGDDGDITVTVTNLCGTSPQGSLAVTVSDATDHTLYNCTSCHITHNAPGSGLTNVAGNALLCQSCHTSTGAASAKPLVSGDNGTSSHAWDVLAQNTAKEVLPPEDSQMILRVVDNKIICSTCHDQHNTSAGTPHLRIDNTGDNLCKDCHRPRNVGLYTEAPSINKGSHPVGITYDGADSRLNTSPTNTQLVSGNVECSSCHGVHDVTGSLGLAANGNLLRTTNDVNLCTDCHAYGTHNDMDCLDCHTVHNTVDNPTTNIYIIKNTIATPNSGPKNVVFTAQTGTNSFADGDGTYDGVCEVCHTTTTYFNNDGGAIDQNHSAQGGPQNGLNCIGCHPHSSNFSPSGGDCVTCHQDNTTYPFLTGNFQISDDHVQHTIQYNYSCSTCHVGNNHNDGNIDVTINTGGMATRNGQDGNTPVFNEDKSCDNVYCHSNGRTAHRGEEADFSTNPWDPDTNPTGAFEWSSQLGPQAATYIKTPIWDAGSITTCNTCHGAAGNMNPDYTITNDVAGPVTGTGDIPPFNSHTRGAHVSNSQNLSGNGWSHVQCFWCHNANSGSDASPNLQGTYSTSLHVDGESYFRPLWYSNGGTMVNTITYSAEGSAGHCGDGKTCW